MGDEELNFTEENQPCLVHCLMRRRSPTFKFKQRFWRSRLGGDLVREVRQIAIAAAGLSGGSA